MLSADLIYGLRPVLLPLLLPPTPPLLLALVGGWYAWRRQRAGAALLVLGVVLAWLSCSERAGEFLLRRLVDPPAPLTSKAIERLATDRLAGRQTAVLVVGGGAVGHAAGYGTADLSETSIERLRYGIWLARRTGAPLGYTGGLGRGRDPSEVAEATLAQRIAAEEFGLPLRWVEAQSRDTTENAAFSVPLLRRDGIERIVVVSHQAHLPRVVRAFRGVAGSDAEIVAASVDGRDAVAPFVWGDWTPSVHGFRKARSAVTEWMGWIAGR
jgi:uncharacterized SAM-binding protein YcdF (DUF218 family)